MSGKQQRYWIGTLKYEDFIMPSPLPRGIAYFRGQCEEGNEGGYKHFQFVVGYPRSIRFNKAKSFWPNSVHLEPVIDIDAALDYCAKDDTRVDGSYVEFGTRPMQRNSKRDWELVWTKARSGDLEDVDASIRVQHYNSLKRIRTDYMTPPVRNNVKLFIYWGVTGAGKSHRAYEEANEQGPDVFYKDADSKWWDGYRGESRIIFDEFTGDIPIATILAWVNWMPRTVEVKGGAVPLLGREFWFTSNTDPKRWWPHASDRSWSAFQRRITVCEEFTEPFSE